MGWRAAKKYFGIGMRWLTLYLSAIRARPLTKNQACLKDKSSFCQSISGVPLAINQMSGEAAKSSRKVRDRKVYKGISTNV
jgi:hypothetical protein